MAQTLPKKNPVWDSRATTIFAWGLSTALVAIAIGIAAYTFGTASTKPGLSDLEHFFPLAANAGCLLLTFVLFGASTWHLLRETKRLRRESTELGRLALVAAKTDNAAFITNPDGNIQWVNDGFVRLTGHTETEALGKQPGPLLLGQLQNLKVTQKIRDGIAHRRILTVEMLCSNRRGHRFWMSLNLTPVVDEGGQVNHFIGIGSDITARRKAEEEVAKVGRRSELLLNAAADGILGFDLEGIITFVNASASKMTGFESDDLIGQPLSSILGQLRINRGAAMQDELFAGAAFIDGSVQIGDTDKFLRKDGTTFPVEYSSTPVHESDNLIGSVVVFRDVTARAESDAMRTRQMRQAALRADVAFGLTNGDSLRSFLGRAMLSLVKHLEGAFARLWTLNVADNMLELQASAGIYSHINGQHSRIPVGTLKVGKIAQDRAPQASENLLADPDILDKEWVARERMMSFIGFPLFLEGNLVGVMALYSRQRLPEDAMELFGCVSDCIAQGIVRKQAEEAGLRQAAILDQANDAIVVVDLDDRIVSWNSAADRLYGGQGVRPLGRPAFEFVTPDKATYEQAKATTLQNGSWQDVFATVVRDGQPVPVESRWTLSSDPSGAAEAIVIVQTETTVRRELEQQVLSGQRCAVVGLLARGLAHQLTDILSPILVSTQTLGARAADDATAESFGLLEANVRRGLDLVQQVLTLGDTPSEAARALSPRAIVENVAGIVYGTFPKTIQVRAEAEENPWTIQADAVSLQQALLNFAILARAVLPEGGVLTLTSRNSYLPEGASELPPDASPGCYASFTFEHTGGPLPEAALALLASPAGSPLFASPASSGSEVEYALQTALQILREHRGFVAVADGPAPGSCLHVFLPAEAPADSSASEPSRPVLPRGNGELVLVVDDEESLLSIAKEALESFGYRALTARDGAEAVAAYSANRTEIRAVITDMLMPNMDGPSTIRVLRKLDPTVPIIASSGMLEPDKVRELTGMSDLEFLAKPYTADDLSQCIYRAVYRAA